MGSTMSLCTNKENIRLRFIKELIHKIEFKDFKGVYCGKGKKSIVQKLLRKYKKENSKEFTKYFNQADVFTLGEVLQEVVKELNFTIEFYDMQTLVETDPENKEKICIVNELPEAFILLFKHFDTLKKKAPGDSTIMFDIFNTWWNILVDKPNENSLRQKERVGRNQQTFEKLIQVILELSSLKTLHKAASLYELHYIDDD